jgi:hypothetical protein
MKKENFYKEMKKRGVKLSTLEKLGYITKELSRRIVAGYSKRMPTHYVSDDDFFILTKKVALYLKHQEQYFNGVYQKVSFYKSKK